MPPAVGWGALQSCTDDVRMSARWEGLWNEVSAAAAPVSGEHKVAPWQGWSIVASTQTVIHPQFSLHFNYRINHNAYPSTVGGVKHLNKYSNGNYRIKPVPNNTCIDVAIYTMTLARLIQMLCQTEHDHVQRLYWQLWKMANNDNSYIETRSH